MMRKFALLTIIIIDLVKKLLVEVLPLFESEFLAETPGDMLRAMSAASIAMVPEPHMGSIKSQSPFHPVIIMMPAANTSLRGASTLSCL